jgi:translocation and assembly module TamA
MIRPQRHKLGLIGLLLPLFLLATGVRAADREPQEDNAEVETETTVAYDVVFDVPDIDGLQDLISQSSQLVSLADNPPASVAGLRRRAEADVERFEAVMKSLGYYQSAISFTVDTDVDPIVVTVTVDPGQQYVLAAFDIAYFGGAPVHEEARPNLDDIAVELGSPAVSDAVIGAEARVVRYLRNRGYPFASADDRLVLADHDDKTIWVQIAIEPGPFVRFGETRISGTDRTEAVYFERRVPWQKGEVYDQRLVDSLRQDLIDAGIFSLVRIRVDEDTDAETRPILIEIDEGPPRTVRAGASYSTEDGPELRFGWQHRNIFGEAELLDLSTRLGLKIQRVDARYRQPDFRRFEQDLVIDGALLNEQFDAYDQFGVTGSAAVEWPVSEHWEGSMGVATEFLQITEDSEEQVVLLFGLPINYNFDNTDNFLNPSEGFRLSVGAAPWTGRIGPVFNNASSIAGVHLVQTDANAAVTFLESQISGSTYLSLDDENRYILAFRARLAQVAGEPTGTLPANHRLYAGGAGSIRGFEFQKAGPLDANNDPLGGRSLVTFGAEFRWRITDTIGIVPFIDGGNVYDSTVPNTSEKLFWGAGLGFRYYTDFGPLRADFAVPLNPRKNIDDPYQFYISLGQAF